MVGIPTQYIGQHVLTRFTLISGVTKFGSKLAKISQLAALSGEGHAMKKNQNIFVQSGFQQPTNNKQL